MTENTVIFSVKIHWWEKYLPCDYIIKFSLLVCSKNTSQEATCVAQPSCLKNVFDES